MSKHVAWLLGIAFFLCGTASVEAAPIVSLQGGPASSIGCLDDASDVKEVDFTVDMNDAPDAARRIAWSMMVDFDEGLLPASGTYESQTCLSAQADSCCNYCNGFHIHGNLREEYGDRVYQFGYAGTACEGICGSGDCDGTTSGIFMKMWVTIDPAYWSQQSPDTYTRYVELIDVGVPSDNNLYSCCGGQSGLSCNGCSGYCYRMGFEIDNATYGVCITVSSAVNGDDNIVTMQPLKTISAAQLGDFEAVVKQQSDHRSQPCTWGAVKSTYR